MGILDFISSVCVQTATYWAAGTKDGYGGIVWPAPVEISCRWDGSTKLITDNNGENIVSKAEILLTQDVDEGGYVCLGTIDDLESSSQENSPKTVDGAYRILRVDKTPLFKSTDEFVYTCFV